MDPQVVTADDVSTLIGPLSMMEAYGRIPTDSELQFAADNRLALAISGMSNVSLAFLADVINIVPALLLHTGGRTHDVGVLEGAENLKLLEIGPSSGVCDLSKLRSLRAFAGTISPGVSSVTQNTNLELVELQDPLPADGRRFAGPIRSFLHVGASNQSSLPTFDHPNALVKVIRARVKNFDLGEVAGFNQLQLLRVDECSDVSNLGALQKLSRLESLIFARCGSRAGWEDVPRNIPQVRIWESKSPIPSDDWVRDRIRGGQEVTVQQAPVRAAFAPFSVLSPEGPDESWAVTSSDFSWIPDMEDPSGPSAESLIRPEWERQYPELTNSTMYDLEIDMFAAYFETRSAAEKFARLAREVSRRARAS